MEIGRAAIDLLTNTQAEMKTIDIVLPFFQQIVNAGEHFSFAFALTVVIDEKTFQQLQRMTIDAPRRQAGARLGNHSSDHPTTVGTG